MKPASFSLTVRKSKNGLRNSLNPSRGSGQSIIRGIKQASFLEIERAGLDGGRSAAVEQGFAALALEEEEEGRLGRWASDDPEKASSQMGKRSRRASRACLRQIGGRLREFLTRVFAYAPALPRWQASEFLATRIFCCTACALGETVPDALPASQACSAWIELARWWIALCDPDEAITRLDRAIDCAPSSLSFSEPLFAALRARWLLTPESQRAAFEEDVTARLRASKHRRSAR